MSEWLTYSFEDFLLFSPRTYYRLFELHNDAIWPAQIAALLLGASIVILLLRPGPASSRAVSAILAVAWIWVAVTFLWMRYATINWAATYFALGFAVQAALLMWIGVLLGRPDFRVTRGAPAVVGLGLIGLGLVLYPLLAPLLGRGWAQMEVFGIAPEPTVLVTLGVLLLDRGRGTWPLLVIPLLWCAVAGATLFAMGSPEAWLMPALLLVTLGTAALARGNVGSTRPR